MTRLLILVLFISIVVIFAARKYDNYEHNTIIDSLNVRHEFVVDSILKEQTKLDSLKYEESLRTDSLKKSAIYWEQRATSLKKTNSKLQDKADSLSQYIDSEKCKEIVYAYKEVNDSLKVENDALGNLANDWKDTSVSIGKSLSYCEKQLSNSNLIINNKDSIINNYTGVLEIQKNLNTSLEKEKNKYKKQSQLLPYGVGAGVVGGIILCLLLK